MNSHRDWQHLQLLTDRLNQLVELGALTALEDLPLALSPLLDAPRPFHIR